jgi:hypothetical protein
MPMLKATSANAQFSRTMSSIIQDESQAGYRTAVNVFRVPEGFLIALSDGPHSE